MFGGVLAACATLLVAGCGGGAKQTAGEPAHTYKIEVLDLTFKPDQAVGRPAKMRIEVRNADSKTIPNIAVTLDSFYYTEKYPELASSQRPIWVVEKGPGAPPQRPVQSEAVSPPGGGQTAYDNTWALGALAPHHTQVFEWTVIPVKSGIHHINIEISAGLAGRSKATLPNGTPLHARFRSEIAPAPPSRHVNPSTGRVELGQFSAQP
jgi:hypothetical protein